MKHTITVHIMSDAKEARAAITVSDRSTYSGAPSSAIGSTADDARALAKDIVAAADFVDRITR